MTQYSKQAPKTIRQMFGSIANRYDKANAVLSFNQHKRWNRRLIASVSQKQEGLTLLDLCAGTGDIAFGYLKCSQKPARAILLDFCPEMLDCAERKEKELSIDRHTVQYVQGDAQHIPFGDNFADCVTVAYGIRNVQNPLACMKEVHRVLQPGGTFGILELTKPKNPFLWLGHQIYLRAILPTVGRFVASNRDAYTYLRNSIREFTPPAKLEKQLQEAGFTNTSRTPLMGGIATIVTAQKP